MNDKQLREENERLRVLIQKIEDWATYELQESDRRHLNSYTHGECGYEEAQEQVLDLLTEAGASSVDPSSVTRQCW